MATETLSVPEDSLAKVIDVIRAGCDYFEDVAGYEEVVGHLREWCDEEQEYLERLEES